MALFGEWNFLAMGRVLLVVTRELNRLVDGTPSWPVEGAEPIRVENGFPGHDKGVESLSEGNGVSDCDERADFISGGNSNPGRNWET